MKILSLFLLMVILVFCVLFPLAKTLADEPPPENPPDTSSGSNTVNIGSPWGSGPETAEDVIENVTNWVLGIAGSLAVLFIIISGIRYITSAGNQAQHEAAKKNLTSAIIGLVIVLIAFFIVQVIWRVLTNQS